jgi:hypothetical protein
LSSWSVATSRIGGRALRLLAPRLRDAGGEARGAEHRDMTERSAPDEQAHRSRRPGRAL